MGRKTKTLTVSEVKHLEPGMTVWISRDEKQEKHQFVLVEFGDELRLKDGAKYLAIIDRPGWHYEVEELS